MKARGPRALGNQSRDNMFENIPNIYVFVGLALFVVGFLAVMLCISRYLENEKDNACKAKLAKMDGTAYDTVNEALSKKFWYGYLVVAIVGAVVSVAISLVVLDFADAYYHIVDETRLMMVYLALSVIVWVIGDYFLFTRLGDSAYFARVEFRAIKTFLGVPDEETLSEDSEPEPNIEDMVAKMTDDEKHALVDALFKRK